MIDRFEKRLRHTRRMFSRSEWALRILGLTRSEETAHERGLVLIQIDGLARKQFEKAMAKGRMPFLRSLLRKQQYVEHKFYPGIPTSTPAVQGELHYGVHCAVPAFGFYMRDAKQIYMMMRPSCAQVIEKGLMEQGEPLLKDGASYSNIYTGGAKEAHFCASSSGWGEVFRRHLSWGLPLIMLTNIFSLLRIIGLTIVELAVAFWDAVNGLLRGHPAGFEFRFIFLRVAICIIMREIIVIGSKVDIYRGLPIIHLNFLGYDEQAHRRGPNSLFAHWALKGIDGAIRRIWKAAQRSPRRDYDVWIFSDHGQEETTQYFKEAGQPLDKAVAAVFRETKVRMEESPKNQRTRSRAQMMYGARSRRGRRMIERAEQQAEQDQPKSGEVVVCAAGPIGHIYAPEPLTPEQRESIGAALSSEAKIPLVFAAAEGGEADVWQHGRRLRLPADATEIFGSTHPHLHEVTRDMLAMIHTKNAGDFVISGWRAGNPMTFPTENGSHAGPGTHETDAFALLPADAPLPEVSRTLRPQDLRRAALCLLGRETMDENACDDSEAQSRESFRIMSYNVHSCVGMDGKLSPQRIARVIMQFDPDIVCLQELDVGRTRSGRVDQAEIIARALNMSHHFHPALHWEEEKYGDAILSRFPMKLVRRGALPGIDLLPNLEPRGAIWVQVEIGGVAFQIINTHLGLVRQERHTQADALMGPEWAGHSDCADPVIMCGDFNSLPRSRACKRITQRFRDAQLGLQSHKPRNTWFGRLPVGRIDHCFVSPEVEVIGITVPRNQIARVASDHLPLVIDMRVPHKNGNGARGRTGAEAVSSTTAGRETR